METKEILENMFYRQSPPPLIIKTEGVYLHDANGRKIIDASGGPMAVNIGYGRQEVAEAAKRSIEKVSYVLPVFASEVRIELAKRIRKLMPDGLGRIYFCSGGSEANEAAIKLARQYHVITGKGSKYKIISRDLSYHGMTIATLSMGDIKMRKRDFRPMLWDSRRIEACYCYRCPFGREYPGCGIECALSLEKRLLSEGPETVSAFIAEPIVASAAGGTVPPPEYFPMIREICDKYEILLILDEVVTGFGRTGKNMGMNRTISILCRILLLLPRAPAAAMPPWEAWRLRTKSSSSLNKRGWIFSTFIPSRPIPWLAPLEMRSSAL